MTLTWTKQPLTREVARMLRAATRKTPVVEGHRFFYNDLKELWNASDGNHHVVCTHDQDPVWQYWYWEKDAPWQLVGWWAKREEAQRAAENKAIRQLPDKTPSGLYVLAWKPGGRTIRVACRSQDPTGLVGIFQRLGYETNTEEVA